MGIFGVINDGNVKEEDLIVRGKRKEKTNKGKVEREESERICLGDESVEAF